jgi:aminopeptidase N
VFRDQEFSGDQGSRAVKRLRDVRGLRAGQFPEDAGPLAHPVRPESYIEIDNFYTPTIYQKGAEVVRMLHTRIGAAAFRRGMDLYFARHDNQAVTIEDFVSAMQDASGVDLARFAGWYDQAGTPEITASETHDAAARRYTLTLKQRTPPTPGQPAKHPLPIPVAMGLLDAAGAPLPTRLAGENDALAGTRVLLLEQPEQSFVFEDVAAPPVPSLLRGFSAPVRLLGVARDRLRFLAVHDTDPFVRWESGQQFATAVLLHLVGELRRGAAPVFEPALEDAVLATLAGAEADPAFAAEALLLPGESYIADQMAVVDPTAIHAARRFLRAEIGRACGDALRATYERLTETGPYRPDGPSIGRRSLRNVCLAYLVAAGEPGVRLAETQFAGAGNMTDRLAALGLLADTEDPARDAALAAFHARWRGDALVLDKWFALQAMSSRADTPAAVRALRRHPDFDLRNPNRARSLIGAFAGGNALHFHATDGAGYAFLADAVIALDPMNGAVAARMVGPLGAWRRQDAARGALMRAALERVLALPGLSRGTFEMASKALA